jgi:uncharacterized protein GlcG (DUF336 family)
MCQSDGKQGLRGVTQLARADRGDARTYAFVANSVLVANLGLAGHGAIVNLGGGIPVALNGELMGAIGVGSRTTEQGIAVAEAVPAALAARDDSDH